MIYKYSEWTDQPIKTNCRVPKWNNVLKIGIWKVRSCYSDWKMKQVIEEWRRKIRDSSININRIGNPRDRNGRVEFVDFGRDLNEKSTGGVTLVVKIDLKVSFDPTTNMCSTLQLQFGSRHLGLLGCYTPTESNPEDQRKEIFYRQLVKTIQDFRKTESTCHSTWYFQLPHIRRRLANRLIIYGCDYKHCINSRQWAETHERMQAAMTKGSKYVFRKPKHKRLAWYHPKCKVSMLDLILSKSSPEVKTMDNRASREVDISSDHCLVINPEN